MTQPTLDGLFWCPGCGKLFRSDAFERVHGMLRGGGGFVVDARELKCPLCSHEFSPFDVTSSKTKAAALAQKGMDAGGADRPWWKFWQR